MSENFAINVSGMTKRFGDATVVDNIHLKVRVGEVCGFLGPNGSGKTTFIRMLCGLLRPDAGEGTCLGKNVITESEEIKRETGYMTQRFSFYEDLSIEENLQFVARIYNIHHAQEKVEESLSNLGLRQRRKQLAGQLSGGWKQRLALAACLIHQPKLLLLDEPTAGVDPKARRDFWEEIHQLAASGLTFLITTHYMDEAERCHRLAFISKGKLLTQGSLSDVIDNTQLATWSVAGRDLFHFAHKLRQLPGIEHAVPFGNVLHISGEDEKTIEKSIQPFGYDYVFQKIPTSLEDVFIHLMEKKAAEGLR